MKYEEILLDPAKAYDAPADVCSDSSLEREQKIKVLHRWEFDARQLLVAEGEGMNQGNVDRLLQDVLKALESLGAESGVE